MEEMHLEEKGKSENTGGDGYWGPLSALECLTPEVFDPHVGNVFRVEYQLSETEQMYIKPQDVADGSTDETHGCMELKLVEVTRTRNSKSTKAASITDHENRSRYFLLVPTMHPC